MMFIQFQVRLHRIFGSDTIRKNVDVDMYLCMNLRGVAVLELDSHPDQDKRPEHAPCACPMTQPIDHRSRS